MCIWIVWIIISITIISDVDFQQYEKDSSYSTEKLNGDYDSIQEIGNENITLEYLSMPTLLRDGDSISVFITKNTYYLHFVAGNFSHLKIENETGKTYYELNRSSGSRLMSYAGGKLNIKGDSICSFNVSGNIIFVLSNSSISSTITRFRRFSGTTPYSKFSTSYKVPEKVENQIDHTVFTIDMKNCEYNITIYDSYFNVLDKKSGLVGKNRFEFNSYSADRNIVFIESNVNNTEMNIQVETKFITQKSYEYASLFFLILISIILLLHSSRNFNK